MNKLHVKMILIWAQLAYIDKRQIKSKEDSYYEVRKTNLSVFFVL